MAMVTQKINNYEYAPGIATYGLQGKTGDIGTPGNSLFYTSYNIYNDANEVKKFTDKIRLQQLPIENSTLSINRPYLNNDYFFDNQGHIYKMYNIEDILSSNSSGRYSRYLKLCGKIDTKDTESFASVNESGRLTINSNYNGIDIISQKNVFSYTQASPYAIRIMSDNPTNDNKILFIEFNAIYGSNLDTVLDIYYDTALNAYHINSTKPVLVDAEFKVLNDNSYTNNTAYDGYSPVVVSDTPITTFYAMAKKFKTSFSFDNEDDDGKCTNIFVDLSDLTADLVVMYNAIMDKIRIKISYDAINDEGNDNITNGTYTYVSKINDYQKFLDRYNVKNGDIHVNTVSYIYNIEVFDETIY